MKLIIRDYLASLKERGELDVILPDLLSQMGLNVYSRPQRGTRQDGVDVAAVGSLNGAAEKVYLFAIKPGDLTRKDWDTGVQALRPSLNEILDIHIRNRIPEEHREKPVVICIALGGEVQEPVRLNVKGFTADHATDRIAFEEWNGDKLAQLIQDHFLREDLLPPDARSRLRKALAMLDEPDTAVTHFSTLIRTLSEMEGLTESERVTRLRQIGVCLAILFTWARDAGNTESAYLAAERTLLHAWEIVKAFQGRHSAAAENALKSFFGIFTTYQAICSEYLDACVLRNGAILHGVSSAIHSSEHVDVNLKLFDVLGRLAVDGLWAIWGAQRTDDAEAKESCMAEAQARAQALSSLISNNPGLLTPLRDDQAIDIGLALMLLAAVSDASERLREWIAELVARTRFAYQVHGHYPCTLNAYSDLLAHPQGRDNEYRQAVTAGSVLYPLLAIWTAILDDSTTYAEIAAFKQESLAHCNFQYWYPDEQTEVSLYTNSDVHGGTLSDLVVDRPPNELLAQVFGECDHSGAYDQLSAVSAGLWPLVLVACRLYRLPPPLHNLRSLYEPLAERTAGKPATIDLGEPK